MSRKDKCTQKHRNPKNNLDEIKIDVFEDTILDFIESKDKLNYPILSVVTDFESNLEKISIHELIKVISKEPNNRNFLDKTKRLKIFDDEDGADTSNKEENHISDETTVFFKSANIDFPESVLANILLTLWMEESLKGLKS